ncbi:MAG: type I phosphomannose isomerase catalytic subunit, partial [Candidatus Limnocylindrales bacterium]
LRPWAGTRLGDPGAGIGELWLAGPGSRVEAHDPGSTLDMIAAVGGARFVGERAMTRLGARFPLIVKLIDAAEWLSLQVHPDDALAAELYGGDALGKVEAWLVLDADPGAELITGPRRDLPVADLRAAIAAGMLGRDECEAVRARPGDTMLLDAGTIHAIGAGAFIYEIEQPSDITFRISDWGRPAAPGRTLHRAESLRAVRPEQHAVQVGAAWRLDGGMLAVPEFCLELLEPGDERAERRPAGASLEVLTVIAGTAEVVGPGWADHLELYETLVVPASVERYTVGGAVGSRVAVGRIG